MTLHEELDAVQARLRELLSHPEATSQDRASLTLASTNLTAIGKRHGQRWKPMDPRNLPPGRTLRSLKGAPDWLTRWEREREATDA
jgi:hypothetical protein